MSTQLRSLRRAAPALLFTHGCIFPALALLMLYALPARAAEPLTAAAVIARGEERFLSLQDYECMVDLEVKLGRKVEAGSGHFWFKQPRMLRLRVTRGPGTGSEVAVDSEGQIRGRQRGLLSVIVKRLRASDRRLHTLRGTSMLELDWGSFFLRYHASRLRPDAQVVLAPRPDTNSPYRVVVTYPSLGKSVREVYSLDPREWVIVEGELYEDQTRVEHIVFRNIKFDTGISTGWFRL
jgi:outer membrane lipoprotein-sorting protein